MTAAYDSALTALLLEAGQSCNVAIKRGIYALVTGPSYETPAEINALRTLGAEAVGMSTVPEVIAARHCDMRVLGISCVTNAAAGILDQPLNHREVLETAARVKGDFVALLKAVLPKIEQALA